MTDSPPTAAAAPAAPGRQVDLVVVNGDGRLLGRMPTFRVDTPWWQDLEPIAERHPGLVVLRLLRTERAEGRSNGGPVSYLVESDGDPVGLGTPGSGPEGAPDGTALEELLADHPLRMPWARPGGPAADLAWASGHVRLTGAPRQVRSWNLSSIWALPTANGTAWLKSVPPFFAHEAAVIEGLGPSAHLPRIIAAEGSRLLMEEMPGRDGYGAVPDDYADVISALLDLQSAGLDGRGHLTDTVPHWSPTGMARSARSLLERRGHQLSAQLGPGPLENLSRMMNGWEARWARVDECGLPEVVFHGDLHPGNARIGVERPLIFDWGDSGWGHPLLDLGVVSAYHDDHALVSRTIEHWLGGWRRMVPGSDPERAWRLLRPIARLRTALVFQNFLDNIEPSEHVYHESDVPDALARAAAGADG